MLEKTCSHKYFDPKMERTPNAYFFMFAYLSGMEFHVSNTILSCLGSFSISVHLWFWTRTSSNYIFHLRCQVFELWCPNVFVGYVGQFHLEVWQTHPKCRRVQQGCVCSEGRKREEFIESLCKRILYSDDCALWILAVDILFSELFQRRKEKKGATL